MKIHEYQGKELLKRYGVPVPIGRAVMDLGDVDRGDRARCRRRPAATSSSSRRRSTPAAAARAAASRSPRAATTRRTRRAPIFGMQLVTHQTGPEGKKVQRLLIEQGLDIARELYLGMVLDRDSGRVTVMASTEGGMEIEEVAAKHPEKILKQAIDPAVGFRPWQARELAFGLGLTGDEVEDAATSSSPSLVRAPSTSSTARSLEINPLVVTKEGDGARARRQDQLRRQRALPPPRARRAARPRRGGSVGDRGQGVRPLVHPLDGNIGCMVNGAGLAMATMDIIKHYGGAPANFLDVGGGATAEKVTAAFKIITRDPRGEGDLRQHLRRHHEVRHHRRRRRRRGQGGRPQGAAGRAARRHQRRARARRSSTSRASTSSPRPTWPTARRRSWSSAK